MDFLEKVMSLIALSGGARSKAMEAIALSKKQEVGAATALLDEASNELKEAHKIQTRLIQEEAAGTKQEVTLLLIHAQDHLMNAMTVKDMAREMVELYEHVYNQNK